MKIASTKRLTVSNPGFLKQRFEGHFAQISVISTMKLRSSVKDVARVMLGKVPPDIEILTKKFLNAPQGVSDKDFIFGFDNNGTWESGSIERDRALQEYIRKYPDHWKTVQLLFALGRSTGRHASAYVIADDFISNFIPMQEVNGVPCTMYTAPGVEWAGGIKLDLLTVNALNDVSEALKLIRQRHDLDVPESMQIDGKRVPKSRILLHSGAYRDVYDLPDDLDVFNDIAEGRTESVFQFSTPGAIQWLRHFNQVAENGQKILSSLDSMAIFTALDRPGPLDVVISSPEGGSHNALVEYVRRAIGKPWADTPKSLGDILPETHGLIVFQEQVEKTYRHLTGCTGAEAEAFRNNVAKKQKEKIDKAFPFYMEHASSKVGEEEAKRVWDFIETFSQYGFCLSEDQLIKTDKGDVPIKDILVKPSQYKLAFWDIKEENIGYEHPSRVWKSGEKEVFEVELEDGTLIQGTLDHKFLYRDEWISLKDLVFDKKEFMHVT